MNVAVVVEVLQGLQSFFEDGSDCLLLEPLRVRNLHEMQTGALVHELHHNPQTPLHSEGAVCLQYVRMIDQAHHLRFPSQIILLQYQTSIN